MPPSPSLKLRPVQPSDAPSLTKVYLSAFAQNSISLLVYPRNTLNTAKIHTDSILRQLSEPLVHFICIVDTALEGEPVIAYAKWKEPDSELGRKSREEDEKEEEDGEGKEKISSSKKTHPEGSDEALASLYFGTLDKRHAEIMGPTPHWYLDSIATRAESQGQGVAGMLIRWGLEKADEDEVETFLEASPAGLPIYQRYGFEEKGRLSIDLRGKEGRLLGMMILWRY